MNKLLLENQIAIMRALAERSYTPASYSALMLQIALTEKVLAAWYPPTPPPAQAVGRTPDEIIEEHRQQARQVVPRGDR